MASEVTNAFVTYDAIGNREDLTDQIYDISPTDTPFMSGIARNTASATFHEWQTDVLAAPTAVGKLEGDATVRAATVATVRLGNFCQISSRDSTISGTQEKVNAAGRRSEMAYQMAKRTKEVKRDIETTILGAQVADAGAVGTARAAAGVNAWLGTTDGTNTVRGAATGADPILAAGTPDTAEVAGTTAATTEAVLNTLLGAIWNNGGEPSTVMVGSSLKTGMSALRGRVGSRQSVSEDTILAAAQIYSSDFGDLRIVPNRFMPLHTVDTTLQEDILILDMQHWSVSYLRSFVRFPLAKIGDAETNVVLSEFTLESRNELSSGKIADASSITPAS